MGMINRKQMRNCKLISFVGSLNKKQINYSKWGYKVGWKRQLQKNMLEMYISTKYISSFE